LATGSCFFDKNALFIGEYTVVRRTLGNIWKAKSMREFVRRQGQTQKANSNDFTRVWQVTTTQKLDSNHDLPYTAPLAFDHDFSRIPVHAKLKAEDVTPAHCGSPALRAKSVSGSGEDTVDLAEGTGPNGRKGSDDVGVPIFPQPEKTAGLNSFVVKWTRDPESNARWARLKLDTSANFKKDATHDPALADFRQNASYEFHVIDGPQKGLGNSQPQMQDDHYSRSDDTGGHTYNDVDFVTQDNPGNLKDTPLHEEDVLDYSFTAEQMIIDTSDSNRVIAKHGPHTATIKGKDPRTFGGVPKTFSWP
jgi:hypothetical protein